MTGSRRASSLGSYASLTIIGLEPLNLQLVALPTNQVILAEPNILRLLEYMHYGTFESSQTYPTPLPFEHEDQSDWLVMTPKEVEPQDDNPWM
ncbi:hypothetical protein BIY22_07400 [Vibrio panuliri]|uniref:Uncharacterized protein n=1 Tax=Vibrio panuliri TaxID=1381081 RepID=A0A1Q9HE24_9VIBR|nr:hypothetical protein [Vibrio panuliri]OLQ87994.1 hypothetical protein BIY22_07400 [Vibrio panuliri]